MNVLNSSTQKQLRDNGHQQRSKLLAGQSTADLRPVAKLVSEDGSCEWLLSEVLPNDPDMAFALCDCGDGNATIGYMSISEILASGISPNPSISQDESFKAEKSIVDYLFDAIRKT